MIEQQYDPGLQIWFATAFLLATIHGIFFTHHFFARALKLKRLGKGGTFQHFFCRMAGNLTSVFAIWLLPTFAILAYRYGGEHVHNIFIEADLAEPISQFVFIFIALSPSFRHAFSQLVTRVANLFGGGIKVWWSSVILIGTILCGVISEASIMVVVCLSLANYVYSLRPSVKFCYLTLGLIILTMSLGNLVLPYNITASLDLTAQWGWSHWLVFKYLGLKAFATICLLLALVVYLLREDFANLKTKWSPPKEEPLSQFLPLFLGFVLLLMVAGALKYEPYFLMLIILSMLLIEKGEEKEERNNRLRLPLLIALFNYSMELHSYFLAEPIKYLYGKENLSILSIKTVLLSGLNEHIPGQSFVAAYSDYEPFIQAMGLAALTIGSGLTLFANSVNVQANKILRETFPTGAIAGTTYLLYSIPLVVIAFIVMYTSLQIRF